MKKPQFLSSRAFRKGTLSLVFTAIIIIAIVIVNIVATAVAEKYPFSVDLTANRDYTIVLSDEYSTYVKNIDMPVTITVCADEAHFNDGTFSNAMAQQLSLADAYTGISETTSKYARQVGAFIKSFGVMNDHITVQFANPNSVTEFASVSTEYANEELSYGDVIVKCVHPDADKVEGNEMERYQIVKMDDMFTTEMNQELYYTYQQQVNDITGSSLASSVVSALYIVTNEKSVEVAVFGGHDVNEEYTNMVQTFLKKNNYTFTNVDSLMKATIPETTTFGLIVAPLTDYSAVEIKALDAFLKNGEKYGRTLVYIPSIDQPELPNLEEFLQEWGIEILPAAAYDESEGAYYQYPYMIMAEAAESEYTEGFDSAQQYFYPMPYRLTRTMFESQDGYTTKKILTTGKNACGMPLTEEESQNWTPDKAEYTGQFDLVTLSTYQKLDSGANVAGQSHVLVISGNLFFYSEVINTTAAYNSTLALNLFNGLSGQNDSTSIAIEDKVISTTNFSEKLINSYTPLIVFLVFVVAIPACLLVLSLVIWIKRKRR
ncbi:MAG: Gldg family protein [Clostridia bacterium]|nr:Gldg family protein [Clostridia bacterium]